MQKKIGICSAYVSERCTSFGKEKLVTFGGRGGDGEGLHIALHLCYLDQNMKLNYF